MREVVKILVLYSIDYCIFLGVGEGFRGRVSILLLLERYLNYISMDIWISYFVIICDLVWLFVLLFVKEVFMCGRVGIIYLKIRK